MEYNNSKQERKMKIKLISYIIFLLGLSLGLALETNLRLLQSKENGSVLIFPIIRKEGKYFINMAVGSALQNITMMIDIAAPQSLIYANRINPLSNATELVYDVNLSNSYLSNSSNSSIDKFYYSGNDRSATNGTISLDDFRLLDINSNTTFITGYRFILNQDDINLRNADGVLTLASVRNIKNSPDADISLLNRLSLDKNTNNSFILINNDETEQDSYLAFGDLEVIKENPLFINLNNINLSDTFDVSSCDVIQNNTYLTSLWSCSLSGVSFKFEDKTEVDATSLTANRYVILDTSIDNILVPTQATIVVIGNDKPVLLIDYLLSNFEAAAGCKILHNSQINYSFTDTYYDSMLSFKFIECSEEPENIQEIGLSINGISYKIDDLFSEIDYVDASGNSTTVYIFDILFYHTWKDNTLINDANNSYWILGNNFLNSFNAIAFDEKNKKIFFFPDNSESSRPNQGSLIVLVFLVPYIIYRRRRKVMMEKLQYEIIYKKMNEISRDYSK
jgi:hypothetical protein